MMDYINSFFSFLNRNKLKISFLFTCVFLFLIILFPFKDINDFVSSQITELTNKAVYVQFDDLKVNPITTTLSLENVLLESGAIESLSINELSVSPSLISLLQQQPGGTLKARGLFSGEAEVNLASGSKNDAGLTNSLISFTSENLNLKQIQKTLNLSFPLQGQTALQFKVEADLTMAEQPEGDFQIIINNFSMASSNLNLPDFGSLSLPEIKFKKVEIKGQLKDGKLVIQTGQLGSISDDFSGTLKGDLGLSFQKQGAHIVPIRGGYNIDVTLVAKPAFKEKAQLFLGFIDQYKTEQNGLSYYKFKLQASNPDLPPQMSPLN